ncbi:hypothetical protein GU927_018925 [Rhodobacteraceae bacterium HSP-20]|uniref:Uncharacterized protein n=1 Tax=Paragemmobacter amnigenus TaxID=2852097 RepID=A0ABS6J839_9RHOB|nr:hypothetical protein [Rhodobacter amnigenus]MBU9699919.1 hypothetical protein [Rhodobacter amnigenus]MBV4391146.1 hypothetical protein [Rhodobacter amnigenus]
MSRIFARSVTADLLGRLANRLLLLILFPLIWFLARRIATGQEQANPFGDDPDGPAPRMPPSRYKSA